MCVCVFTQKFTDLYVFGQTFDPLCIIVYCSDIIIIIFMTIIVIIIVIFVTEYI